MVRLFVALPLPEMLRQSLALLGGGVPGAKWTPVQNFHLTLKFIGEVDERTADDIVSALDGVRADAFDLSLHGIGTFEGKRGPRLLYAAGVATPELLDLEARVSAALARVPGLEVENRRFTPHVTLARLKDPDRSRLGAFIERSAGFAPPPWHADHFALYSSVTGGEHSVYTLEERFELDEAA